MRKWTKTTIEWKEVPGTSLLTHIPTTIGDSATSLNFTLREVTAVSRFNGKALLVMNFLRNRVNPPSKREQQIIYEFLKATVHKFPKWRAIVSTYGDKLYKFQILFSLVNREHFCDTAITVLSTLYEALSIQDPEKAHLSRFVLQQETFIVEVGTVTPYADYLRKRHNLPPYDPTN